MIDERFDELAALYALGLLEGAERRDFEARLHTDAELAEWVAAYEADAAALALAVPPREPSADLKQRVLTALTATPPAEKVIAFSRWKIAVPWLLAASLAVMAFVLNMDRSRLKDEVATLEARDSLAQVKIATLGALADGYAKGVAVVLWDGDKQSGVLKVSNMPVPRADQDYQLWVVDPAYKLPVDAGVFHPEPGLSRTTFKPTQPIKQAQKFAISLERKGGAPQHEGPIVMLGE